MNAKKILDYFTYFMVGIWLLGFAAWVLDLPIDWGTYSDRGPMVLEIGVLVVFGLSGLSALLNKLPAFFQQYKNWIFMGVPLLGLAFLSQWALNTWIGRETLQDRLLNSLILGFGCICITKGWQHVRRQNRKIS